MIKRVTLLSIVATLSLQANAQSLADLSSTLLIKSKPEMMSSTNSLPYAGKDMLPNHINKLDINYKVIC